jgi:hypothetical protein
VALAGPSASDALLQSRSEGVGFVQVGNFLEFPSDASHSNPSVVNPAPTAVMSGKSERVRHVSRLFSRVRTAATTVATVFFVRPNPPRQWRWPQRRSKTEKLSRKFVRENSKLMDLWRLGEQATGFFH